MPFPPMEFTAVAVAGSLPQPPSGSSGIADHGAAGHDRGETPVQTGANTRHRTESALLDFRVNPPYGTHRLRLVPPGCRLPSPVPRWAT